MLTVNTSFNLPILGGMMPVHPQMRQQYPPGPYGQQPLPPMPPQQGGGAPQTTPQGPDDGGSVNTGESDNATPSQQQPQQQQPYMQQPGPYGAPPPGAYPYAPQYGQMQGRYPMHPGQQMHQPVLPPGGPRPMYPQQYMGGAPQMMSQYPPQHMGGGPMHRNQPYYNGPPQGYNPQQHGGNNPDQDNKNRNNNNNNNHMILEGLLNGIMNKRYIVRPPLCRLIHNQSLVDTTHLVKPGLLPDLQYHLQFRRLFQTYWPIVEEVVPQQNRRMTNSQVISNGDHRMNTPWTK